MVSAAASGAVTLNAGAFVENRDPTMQNADVMPTALLRHGVCTWGLNLLRVNVNMLNLHASKCEHVKCSSLIMLHTSLRRRGYK